LQNAIAGSFGSFAEMLKDTRDFQDRRSITLFSEGSAICFKGDRQPNWILRHFLMICPLDPNESESTSMFINLFDNNTLKSIIAQCRNLASLFSGFSQSW
jgi:hypothetical protein